MHYSRMPTDRVVVGDGCGGGGVACPDTSPGRPPRHPQAHTPLHHTPSTPHHPPPVDRQTHVKTLPFPILRMRSVIT